jgi:hypothetical protein
MDRDYFLGLDLGQARDFSALAVLERTVKPDEEQQVRTPKAPWEGQEYQRTRSRFHYVVRFVKRWPLATPYTQIVPELGRLVGRGLLENARLVVDQTGVGAAIVDMLRQARINAYVVPVLITAGHATTSEGGIWHVPKRELVGTLQVLLQSRRLQVAPLPERELLVREFLAFRVKITKAGNETFESLRERDHDDLVIAIALAAWLGERSAVFHESEMFSHSRRTLRDRMEQPSAAQRRGLFGLPRP